MTRTVGTSQLGRAVALRWPAVVGFVLTVPFAALEMVNRSGFNEGFPFVLFALLWVLPAGLFWVTSSTIRIFRSDRAHASVSLILRIGMLGLIASFWIALLTDQMPCFLGVPNCD